MAWHVPVFTGAADGICGDEVCKSSDGAGGASGRRDEWNISDRAGRGVDGSAVAAEVEGHGLLVRIVWSLLELGGDGAGRGLGNWRAFSDYRRWAPRPAVAGDIYYSDVYVSGAGDCRIGGAG